MIKKYSEFLLENVQRAKSIYKQKLEDYEAIKTKLEKSNRPGWMGKFTEFLFSGVPKSELETLFDNLEDLKRKNITINIDSYKTYEAILDDIQKKLNLHKLKLVLSRFPKKQKDLVLAEYGSIDNIVQSDILKFIKLGELENNERFFRAISSYESYQELMTSLRRFLNSTGKKYTREYIKSLLDDKLILKHEDETLIILETITHGAICKVGDDTSWCIVRSAQQFANYTIDGRKQFVLIDYSKETFDNLYKIGFTVSPNNRILYAHNVLDGSCIPYLENLLIENKIDVAQLNKREMIDPEKLKSMKFKDASSYILSNPITVKEKLVEVIEILRDKIRTPSQEGEYGNILLALMKGTLKVSFIDEKEFDKYKTSVAKTERRWKVIKDYFINQSFVITNKPIRGVMGYSLDIHKQYYKNWKFKIDDEEALRILLRKPDVDWSRIILLYLEKIDSLSTGQQLVYWYCKKQLGVKISDKIIEDLITEFNTELQGVIKLKNIFGIKYRITQALLQYRYFFDWNLVENYPVKLTMYQPESTPSVQTLKQHGISYFYEMSKSSFLKWISGVTLKNEKKITFQKSFLRLSKDKNTIKWYDEIIPLLEKDKTGNIKFKEEVKFPIEIKYETVEGETIPINIIPDS